ncbi:Hypothetical predicted protein [Mytilus galloprovincialis]|uniref:2'-phosphotransferase n=1 Tax=Mytilus galloprovincialis TaxID=29158 RepID=A0A8B6DVK5_MYTGA|nr:Hypothetical predicted protein [Mytilus galloprovincialis]
MSLEHIGHGAPELDHSLLPGGYLLVEEILKRDPGFAGYSLPDIHKLIKVDVDRRFTLIKDSDSGCWKIRANQGYSLMVDTPAIPLVEKCEVPQGNLVTAALLTGDQEGSVANIMRKPIGAILAVENHSSIQKVAATTETTLASDEEAQESWDSTSDIIHPSLLRTLPQREKLTEKAATESNSPLNNEKVITFKSPVNQESVYINPESPDLGLGLLFKTDNVGTRYFNQQQPPPVDSGTSVFCVSTVRSGPNRRQWDPGIPYLNKGINTVQVRKNVKQTLHDREWISTTSWVQLYSGHATTKWTGSSLYKDGEELAYDPDKNNSQLSGFPIVGNPLYYLLVNQ